MATASTSGVTAGSGDSTREISGTHSEEERRHRELDISADVASIMQKIDLLKKILNPVASDIESLKQVPYTLIEKYTEQVHNFDIDKYMILELQSKHLTSILEERLFKPKIKWDDFDRHFQEISKAVNEMVTSLDDLRLIEENTRKAIKHITELKPEEWPKNQNLHFLWQIAMIIRFTFRGYFGESYSKRWGFFLDKIMIRMIHHYAYDVAYPEDDHILTGHSDKVVGIAISDDDKYLFTGSEDKSIIVWDMTTHEKLKQWVAHDKAVNCLAYQKPGLLISGSWDSTIRVWNTLTYEMVQLIKGHKKRVLFITFNKKGDLMATAATDFTLRMWSFPDGDCIRVFKGHTTYAHVVHFLDDVLISTAMDKTIRVWNPITGENTRTITEGIKKGCVDLSINCDQTLVACTSVNYCLNIYSWPDMKLQRNIPQPAYRGHFHPSNPNLFALGDYRKFTVIVYDVSTGERVSLFKGHTNWIRKCRFTRDGSRLITMSNDSTIRIWDTTHLCMPLISED